MMSVAIDNEQLFGTPAQLFDGLDEHSCVERDYDISPVDQRFLVVRQSSPDEGIDPVVILNWSEELKRLAPIAD